MQNGIKQLLTHFLPGPVYNTCAKPVRRIRSLPGEVKTSYQLHRKLASDKATTRQILTDTPLVRTGDHIKPVYFFGGFFTGAFKLKGTCLIEALQQAGIHARIGNERNVDRIRDAIIVYVKERIPGHLARIKDRGNKIIINMCDNFILEDGALHPNYIGRDVADYLLFPNQALLDKFLSIKPTTSRCLALHGFADPSIALLFKQAGYRDLNELKCCYFGYDFNLNTQVLNSQHKVDIIPLTENTFAECLNRLRDYNLHIDLRPQGEDNLYKPLQKLFNAAECRANIIVEKTQRVLEILPEDYPFLLEDHNAQAMLQKTHDVFGTPDWYRASAMMEAVRQKYTIGYYCNEFIKILEQCSGN